MTPSPPASRIPRWKLFALGAVVLAAIVALKFLPVQAWLKLALEQVRRLGVWAPVIFILIYAVATVCFVPGTITTLAGGALFGPLWGTVYTLIGATLGATGGFLVGRHFARDWVAAKIGGNRTFAALDHAVAREGWKIVGLARMTPIFPFILLNYAFGLTRVRLRDYVLATFVGMIPASTALVYVGSLAQQAAGPRPRSPVEWAFYGVGLVATLAMVAIMTRIARRALSHKIEANPPGTAAP